MTQLSAYPARCIDTLLLHRSDTLVGYLHSAVATRAVSVLVFPITTAIDTLTNGAVALAEGAISLLPLGAESRAAWSGSAYRCAVSSVRHFAALLASPTSLITPDILTHHFIPLTEKAKNEITPYGQLYKAKGILKEPRTFKSVQRIVNAARRQGKQVAISGAGFSQGKHILPTEEDHIHINLRHIKHTDVHPTRKTISVGAGATWEDVQKAANEHGLAVKTMQASNVFSVGGSLGINCHGWDIQAGALGNTVRSLTIVDASGKLKVLTKEDELFRLVVGGIGMFGVIVSAELELTDNVELERTGEAVRPVDYLSYFRDLQEAGDVEMHLGSLSLTPGHLFEEVVAENYRRVSDEAHVTSAPAHSREGSSVEKIALHYARNRQWMRSFGWSAKKADLLEPKTATRNAHMTFPIWSMFNHSKSTSDWLQEYFVPPEQLNLFIRKLKEILEANNVPLYNASIRYVAQDESSELSYARDGEKFAIVLCFGQSMAPDAVEKTQRWVREATDFLATHGGTYYLPYQQFATKEQFRACHPEWEIAQSLKRKYDPDNVFYSGFGKEYVDTFNKAHKTAGLLFSLDESVSAERPTPSPRTVEASRPSFYRSVFGDSEKRAHFKNFLENIFQQLDTEPFFTLIDDILKHATTDEDIYTELQARIGEAQTGAIATAFRALGALRGQVKAVSEQFAESVPEDKTFDGYVELETPGRFVSALKKKRSITGKVTVVNHERSAKDYIEAGFPLPFHKYVDLDGYKPLDSEALENRSVELVTCFKGLHHIQPENLDAFVQSIHRILKPGGSFILRDHDADTDEMFELVDVVHSIFNAATDEPWDVEKAEVRNFHGLSYWQSLLERNGFRLVSDGKVREGDPTANTLLRFEKVVTERDEALSAAQAHVADVEGYRGDEIGITFQAAEWENVHAAERYAEVIRTRPFYEFQFMSHLGQFWHVFHEALKTEVDRHGILPLMTSFYTYMVLFVGITMTVEYSVKAAISTPLLWAFGESDGRPLPIQMLIEDPDGRAAEVDERVRVHERIPDTPFTRIELRRFDEMREFVERAVEAGIRPVEIAGAREAQLRLHIPSDDAEVLRNIDGLRTLFQWDDVENPEERLAQVRVQVENLPEILRTFEERGVRLEFVHDL